MLTIAGRTLTLRSQRPATVFTPIAAVLFLLFANGTAIDWQRTPADSVWFLDGPFLVVTLLGTADCLERLVSSPARSATPARLITLLLSTVLLTSLLFGPLTLGILRWASLLVALPWAVMVGLTVREGSRTTRHRRTVSVSST